MDLLSPKIMGILNLSPDSFFDGGSNDNLDTILLKVAQMLADGMDILDIGAVSSRPGAGIVDTQEEISKVIPVLKEIRANFPKLLISLDSYNFSLIDQALEYDINMINDITGGSDRALVDLISQTAVAYTIMHMQNEPSNMQKNPVYGNVTLEVLNYLSRQAEWLKSRGIQDLVIDPGFGFGKTLKHNYELLKKLSVFRVLDCPLLVGVSRKSMIYKPLKTDPATSLNGTTAIHMLALNNGAKLLRVHDVKEAKECVDLFNFYLSV